MKKPDAKFKRKLAMLLRLKGIPLSHKIETMAAFFSRVASTHEQAVIMAPCGVGKSLSATAYAAASATVGAPVILIVQDRRTMFDARSDLSLIMNPDDIGLYAGWDRDECHSLNPGKFTFRDCLRDASDSECTCCRGRSDCNYCQSRAQLKRPVVVMTLASFLLLCEKGQDFGRHLIICDEDLLTFSDVNFTADELDFLHRLFTIHGQLLKASNLLPMLFPSLRFSTFHGVDRIPDQHIRFMTLAGWDRSLTGRVIRHIKADPARFTDCEELLFRFLMFFRTCAACGADYAYSFSGDMLCVKKNRLDLKSYTSYRQFFVLNATAALSLNEFAPGTKIVTCAGLDKYKSEASAQLYVVVGNPTMTRRRKNIKLGMSMIYRNLLPFFADGCNVLVPCNASGDEVPAMLATRLIGQAPIEQTGRSGAVHKISRGRLRGTNDFRMCTSAFFVAAGFFTSIEDCTLHAVLRTGQDMAWSEVVCDGMPVMHKGRFRNEVVQDVYMRKVLTEMYQGVYRTAIRDGRDVQVVIALPSADWLVPLRQLMSFVVVDAEHVTTQIIQAFIGLSALMNLEPGTTVGKRDAAAMLGYEGDTGWKDHRDRISSLLEPFFEIPHSGHTIGRRDFA